MLSIESSSVLHAMLAAREAVMSDGHMQRLIAALERLRAIDPVAADLVRMRFVEGHTLRECADALGLSLRSGERRWAVARAWLRDHLDDDCLGDEEDDEGNGSPVPL